MRSRGMRLVGAALLVGLVLPGRALAVGPSPGAIIGSPGASWQGHLQRFEAAPGGLGTRITEVAPGGATLRSTSVPGRFGIPEVAYDGSTELLPAHSSSLVLAPWDAPPFPHHTEFVVVSTRDLHVRARVTLPGVFAFDALSPDGATLYLTQHASASNVTRYTVRAYDLRSGRLLPGVIADRSTGEWRMDGIPTSRLQAPGGGWAYTLYEGGEDGAFVHALDTGNRTAHCIDLPGLRHRNVMAMRTAPCRQRHEAPRAVGRPHRRHDRPAAVPDRIGRPRRDRTAVIIVVLGPCDRPHGGGRPPDRRSGSRPPARPYAAQSRAWRTIVSRGARPSTRWPSATTAPGRRIRARSSTCSCGRRPSPRATTCSRSAAPPGRPPARWPSAVCA